MPSLEADRDRQRKLAGTQVVPKEGRCVQCGICSYYCPVEIDVRRYAWRNAPVDDSRCISCGECVKRCPRTVLRFSPVDGAIAGR